ncbi:hypothetical protein ACV566_14225 [Staphylococcus aureus]
MIRPGFLFMGSVIMTKKDVIKLLEQIATYMELKGKILLKYQRIEKQLKSLELDERPLDEISDVTELKGIGKGVAEVINDYRETG